MDSNIESFSEMYFSEPSSTFFTSSHVTLPTEIWHEIMSYTTRSSIQNLTLTCRHFRWLAQPSLFKLFIVRFNYSITPIFGRRDIHFASSLARLSVLQNVHIARGITEIRLLPTTFLDQRQRDQGFPTPQLVDTFFSYLPSLINLRTLVCHDIEFSKLHLGALGRIPRLTELELQSCRTSCHYEDFPSFSSLMLDTLKYDYPFNAQGYFSNHRFLSLLIQPGNLRKVSVGPTKDMLFAMSEIRPPPTLSVLKIPVSCVESPLFLPVIASCPSVHDLWLHITTGETYLPSFDYLPSDILPNLRSYHGPHIYSPWFTKHRPIESVDFILSAYPQDLHMSIGNLSDKVKSFSCTINSFDATLIQAIHMACPSLEHLTISGASIDISSLSSALSIAKAQKGLRKIEMTMDTGASRLTNNRAIAVANMFVSKLIRTYPFLEHARLVYQPHTSIVWACLKQKSRPIATIDDLDLSIEKAESSYKTNTIWDSLRFCS